MISKNEVKYIQSLFHKKNRDEQGVFIVENPRLVDELLQTDFVIRKIYATNQWLEKNPSAPDVQEVSGTELQKLSNLQTPQQVLAIVEKKKNAAAPSLNGKITLVLDGIQDPGNLGTIIRIADWFGIDQIIASEDTADCYNPKVIQSTMGSIIRVNIWYKDLKEALEKVSIPVYGALLHGKSIYNFEKIKSGLLVIGNESKGIREPVLSRIDQALTIPRMGAAESLNAAVATGIILSHLVS